MQEASRRSGRLRHPQKWGAVGCSPPLCRLSCPPLRGSHPSPHSHPSSRSVLFFKESTVRACDPWNYVTRVCFLWLSPCTTVLTAMCLCCPGAHLGGGSALTPTGTVRGSPQFMRGFWVQEGISSLREACRSRSCHSADMSFSDYLGSQGQFRLHILKLQMEAKLAAWKWRPVMLRDLSKILSVCAHSHDLHVQRGA